MPLIVTYKNREMMVYERTSKKFVAKYESDIFLDKLSLRIGAVDTTCLWGAIERLTKDYETFKTQPGFPKFSKFTDHEREERDLNEALATVIFHQTRFMKNGLQIVKLVFIITDST
jgi:hypothetical protein